MWTRMAYALIFFILTMTNNVDRIKSMVTWNIYRKNYATDTALGLSHVPMHGNIPCLSCMMIDHTNIWHGRGDISYPSGCQLTACNYLIMNKANPYFPACWPGMWLAYPGLHLLSWNLFFSQSVYKFTFLQPVIFFQLILKFTFSELVKFSHVSPD